MSRYITVFFTLLMVTFSCNTQKDIDNKPGLYTFNKKPLIQNKYSQLPLGAIKPEGWLHEQLIRMRDGLTGDLDEKYPEVIGNRNGWLGGDGDGWERGPYWLDGLVPLAYILNDQALIDKAKPWIEWAIENQREDGYFGPIPFEEPPTPEPGIQKSLRKDWWPKMVMLKVLQQYYSATKDKRVIELMTNYFRYQLKELPGTPLDSWSFWANRRGGDNLMIVYWLYNITGDKWLLDLGELIHEQTYPYTRIFLNTNCEENQTLDHVYSNNTWDRYPFTDSLISKLCVSQLQSFHCVNLAQGIKQPIIYYQQNGDPKHIGAVKKAFRDIRRFHGQPQGMYGGDEPMHGTDPGKGVEFCSIVEMMFSLENMIRITGDIDFADHLEKVAYNALPAQATDDFKFRQYFQCANQVLLTRTRHNFYEDDSHDGTDLSYGLISGYPCCTCNMHQGWPKLVQNLWYATPDRGLAAIIYGPSSVEALVGDGVKVRIEEDTNYPFDQIIQFTIRTDKTVEFPLHLRIPSWCKNPKIDINSERQNNSNNGIVVINRKWKDGDKIVVDLPMNITTSRWHENSIAIERGPLVYSYGISENWQWVENDDKFGSYFDVYPRGAWNFGLVEAGTMEPENMYEVEMKENVASYPWNLENAPVKLIVQAKKIPEWKLYGGMAGPLPHSRPQQHLVEKPSEEIELVPYGCTTLRITEFPVVR